MGPRSDPRNMRPLHRGSPSAKGLPPGLPALRWWFERSNLALREGQYQQLWQYHRLLRARNAEYDLTRIYRFDSMVQKHYIDSMLPATLLDRLPTPLLDIGTGPGLPGIPLKIISPRTHIILSEGRHRRVRFLREAVSILALKGIEVHEGKIYATYDRPVEGIITRAVEPMGSTLARVRRCLVPGGLAIFMKGPNCDTEIEEALARFSNDYTLVHDLPYVIPHSPHRRRLVVFERMPVGAAGFAGKDPLMMSPAVPRPYTQGG